MNVPFIFIRSGQKNSWCVDRAQMYFFFQAKSTHPQVNSFITVTVKDILVLVNRVWLVLSITGSALFLHNTQDIPSGLGNYGF